MTTRVPALRRTVRPSSRPDEVGSPVRSRRSFAPATLVAVLALLGLALTWAAPVPALDALAATVEWARAHAGIPERAALSVVLLAAALLAFVAAWARATDPARPVRVPGGRGTIAVQELATWLRDAVEARADVRDASVSVRSQGKGVRVAVRIAVTADARLQETSRGARSIVEEVLATRVGVPLAAEPTIELHYQELRLRPRGSDRRMERAVHDA